MPHPSHWLSSQLDLSFVRRPRCCGRDAGRATLELLGSWNPAIAGSLARIDIFTLWWSRVLSAGVAIVTGRSYPLTAVLVTGVNVLLLLAGRGLIPS